MSCPDWEELLSARASPAGHSDVIQHLESDCPHCSTRWRTLEALASTFAKGPFPRVSSKLERFAADLPGRLADRVLVPERFVGALIFDSARSGAALAIRGASLAPRHVLYRAGPYEIDVAIVEPSTLVGQILPVKSLENAVTVLLGDQNIRQIRLERNGDFRFDALESGEYTLVIESSACHVVVPDLVIAADAREE